MLPSWVSVLTKESRTSVRRHGRSVFQDPNDQLFMRRLHICLLPVLGYRCRSAGACGKSVALGRMEGRKLNGRIT